MIIHTAVKIEVLGVNYKNQLYMKIITQSQYLSEIKLSVRKDLCPQNTIINQAIPEKPLKLEYSNNRPIEIKFILNSY